MTHRPFLRAAALGLAALLLGSCLSVHTRRRPLDRRDGALGGVELRVYADDAARRAGTPGPRGLFVELERRQAGDRYAPVFRSLEPTWSVMGVPAGEYRLRFPARLDEEGNVVRLDEQPRRVRVRAGEVTEVDATLEHVNRGLIAAGVVTAVVAAILLEDWLDDHDLPVPPLALAAPDVAETIFYLSIDAGGWHDEPWRPAGPGYAPAVTSHFPPDGALVAARRMRITFALSEPLEGSRWRADGVTVLADHAGVVPGTTSYDGERWWVVWEADDDLPRADLLHVTLAADAIEDLRGENLSAPVSFSFRTTP